MALGKTQLARVLEEVLEVAGPVFERHGLSASGSLGALHPYDVDFVLHIRAQKQGVGREAFGSLAGDFGLQSGDYGKIFSWDGRDWSLVGLNPRAPRNPIEALMLPSGVSRRLPREALWAIRQTRASG
jgi:hypothetical protein